MALGVTSAVTIEGCLMVRKSRSKRWVFKRPTRFSGKHVYKYGTVVEWLEAIIPRGELYFPTPAELNDEDEAKPKFKRPSPNRRVLTLAGNSAQPGLSYAQRSEYLGQHVRHSGVDRTMKMAERDFYELFENHARIYSLSKRANNAHLWKKYAGNNSGYCLEFRCEGHLFSGAHEVRYVEGIRLDVTDPEQVRPDFFFYKTPKWSKEEEVRLIRSRTDDPIVRVEPITLLNRIFVGRRMSEADCNIESGTTSDPVLS